MSYSKHQILIFDNIKDSKDNLVVNAKAGSGKTFTIVKSLDYVTTQNILFCAFNKHIANELATKVPPHVMVKTINSLGFEILRKNMRSRVDIYKTGKLCDQIIKNQELCKKLKYSICKIVSLIKANYPIPITIEEIMEEHGINLPNHVSLETLKENVLLVYERGIKNTETIDFDDQIFLPVYLDMDINKVDLVFCDEIQDLNPVQTELLFRVSCRFVGVGDPQQAIYGFRGADIESINNIVTKFKAKVLPLSICYRCAKSVVLEAQKIVPDIEVWDGSIAGSVSNISLTDFRQRIAAKCVALCRTTAPLVKECLQQIRMGKNASVKGREIGKNLTDIVKGISFNNLNMSIDDFEQSLDAYEAKELERLRRSKNENLKIELIDKVETLRVFCEDGNINNVTQLLVKIDFIFSEGTNTNGITFMTVHKSKGLEAENIFILHPELMPHPKAERDWQRVQENNLKYVAITRAKVNLYWVN